MTGFIEDDSERREKISVALRHIARHRGWRNPYHSVNSLLGEKFSSLYEKLVEKAKQEIESKQPGVSEDDLEELQNLAPSQLVCRVLRLYPQRNDNGRGGYSYRLRKTSDDIVKRTKERTGKEPDHLLPDKLHQSDNAIELRRIFEVQQVPKDEWECLFRKVFAAEDPTGSAERRVGVCPLDGGIRAPKASLVFQEFRIAHILANIRVKESGSKTERALRIEERKKIYQELRRNWFKSINEKINRRGEITYDIAKDYEPITWEDIANSLGIKRNSLVGVGALTNDGEERVVSRPPSLNSIEAIYRATTKEGVGKLAKELLKWFKENEDNLDNQEAMIDFLSNSVKVDLENQKYASVLRWIKGLDDKQLGELDKISLPSGRAAYSLPTLRKLTNYMLENESDLHEARKACFGVDDSWRPPSPPIGETIGHPAVDRVLKIVNRYLVSCEKRWGQPERVIIEHVRAGFSSVDKALKDAQAYEKILKNRTLYRQQLQQELRNMGITSLTRGAIRKQEALQRQNCKCLYCGRCIGFIDAQLDHIIPRQSNMGCTNDAYNLVAVCGSCNTSKSNKLFSEWCRDEERKKQILELVEGFILPDAIYSSKEQKKKFRKEVKRRLEIKSSDEPIDNRSIESTAWMADELHRRIEYFFNDSKSRLDSGSPTVRTKVVVFRGAVTAEARYASGIENKIKLVGNGKTRFDRRHHAIDAAVIAFMTSAIAEVLRRRSILRDAWGVSGVGKDDYKNLNLLIEQDKRYLWDRWMRGMGKLCELLNEALEDGRVPITQNMRFKLGNSKAHMDNAQPLVRKDVSDALDVSLIKRSSTPELHRALVGLDDYSPEEGLPRNPYRRIYIKNRCLEFGDKIEFFSEPKNFKDSPQIRVKNAGFILSNPSVFHHVRVYRLS